MKKKDFISAADSRGYRRSRLAESRQQRRRRLTRFIMVAGIVIAVLIFVGVSIVMRARNSGGGNAALEQAQVETGSGNVIMVGKDDAGKIFQVAVLVAQEGGYSLYIIPARTVAGVPELGFQRLDKLYEDAGQGALDQAVADLLQVPIQYHVVFTNPVVELAAEQAGVINIKAARALFMNPPSGSPGEVITIPPGENPTGLSMAMSLFTTSAADNRDGPTVAAAFYQGLYDGLGGKPEVDRRSLARQLLERIETDMDEGDFVDLVVASTAPEHPVGVWPVPVRVAGAGADWYFEPVPEELQALITGSPEDAAYQIEVQNGTEAQGIVEVVAVRLESLRYNMTLKPEPSGVNFDFTQIRCGSEALDAGNRVRDLLGTGTIIKDDYLEKQQILVIIGRDLGSAIQ